MNAPAIQIDGIIIPVHPHPEHEYTLPTAEVAAGYGVIADTIRRHKKDHADELLEGKHFISVRNPHSNPRGGIPHVSTHWTKRGIIRLGFFIKSERAKRFRDLAEDLVVREIERPALALDHAALVSAVGELAAEVRSLREALVGHAATQATQPSVAARPSRPTRRYEARADVLRFFREHVEATGDFGDRLPVGELHAAYLRWCRDSATCPHYHTANTLSKTLLAVVPGLRGHYRRCLLPDGSREVCYLAHQLI